MSARYERRVRAQDFADAWYRRPESGRDAGTLAYLLETLLADEDAHAAQVEQARIAAKLAEIIGK